MKSLHSQLLLSPAFVALAMFAGAPHAATEIFRQNDPVWRESDRLDAGQVRAVKVSPTWYGWQVIRDKGDGAVRRALNLNSVDAVPDSDWFTNRIGHQYLSVAEIARGPDTLPGPPVGPWTVVAGKSDGVTPGLRLRDAKGRLFFVKFDPKDHAEMASGAEVIATKLLFALGYWVPENYIATLRREDLSVGTEAMFTDSDGVRRPMRAADVDHVLAAVARNRDGSYRMLASRAVEGTPVGPFLYSGTRPDDPNDRVPHQDRRELRGLLVFAAWLNHVDTKGENSLDTLVNLGDRTVVRHYLIDFGSALGSAGTEPKDWRDGYEYAFEPRTTLLALLTLGTRMPPWVRIRYPHFPSIGRIDSRHFNPEQWKPTLPNPAFQNARADDKFWAAERVMAFSDEGIRAVVATARFSDPAAERYLGEVLIERRNAIGRAWLTDVNPVSRPFIDAQGHLVFHNAALAAGATSDRPQYQLRWSTFDNATGQTTPLGPWTAVADSGCDLPVGVASRAPFLMAEIAAIHPRHPAWAVPVRAYFRAKEAGAWTLVGFERLDTGL